MYYLKMVSVPFQLFLEVDLVLFSCELNCILIMMVSLMIQKNQ